MTILVVVSIGDRRAEIVAFDGVRAVLRCPAPSPPGSSLSCAVDGAPTPVRVKVASCKRDTDGTFTIEGRLVDLTREQRAALEAAGQSGSNANATVPPSQRPPTR